MRLAVLLFALLPAVVQAGEIPYSYLHRIFNSKREFERVRGARASIILEKSRKEDARDFDVFVDTSSKQIPINLRKDGSFELPYLPDNLIGVAKVKHSLERGALKITFRFYFNADEGITNAGNDLDVITACMEIKEKFTKIDWDVFSEMASEPIKISITGILAMSKSGSLKGLADIKSSGKLVNTIDLSQKGNELILFSKYDPESLGVNFKDLDPDDFQYNFVINMTPSSEKSKNEFVIVDTK